MKSFCLHTNEWVDGQDFDPGQSQQLCETTSATSERAGARSSIQQGLCQQQQQQLL